MFPSGPAASIQVPSAPPAACSSRLMLAVFPPAVGAANDRDRQRTKRRAKTENRHSAPSRTQRVRQVGKMLLVNICPEPLNDSRSAAVRSGGKGSGMATKEAKHTRQRQWHGHEVDTHAELRCAAGRHRSVGRSRRPGLRPGRRRWTCPLKRPTNCHEYVHNQNATSIGGLCSSIVGGRGTALSQVAGGAEPADARAEERNGEPASQLGRVCAMRAARRDGDEGEGTGGCWRSRWQTVWSARPAGLESAAAAVGPAVGAHSGEMAPSRPRSRRPHRPRRLKRTHNAPMSRQRVEKHAKDLADL